MYSLHVNILFSVTSVKCENCHEVLFSSSKKDVPKEKLIEPAEVNNSVNEMWSLWNALNICRANLRYSILHILLKEWNSSVLINRDVQN